MSPQQQKTFRTQDEVNAQNQQFYSRDLERWQRVGEAPLNEFEVGKIKEFIAICPPGKILDLGTGSGRFLNALIQYSGVQEVEGVELVPQYVEGLEKKGLPVREGKAEDLAFAGDETIAGIFANALILHFLKDYFRTVVLSEWKRVLKTGGGLYFTFKPGEGEAYDRNSTRPMEERRFLSYYSSVEIREYLESQDFEMVEDFLIEPFVRDGEQIVWNEVLAKKKQ